MRVSYPLKDISTDTEAKNYFGHRNLFGKYPISAHNTWHGGVHLEGDSQEIQCIANGRIIAYRFTKEYKKTVINNNDHLYSNGFILIQHDYKSKEKQKMTFYSLYHHLMPESDINSDKNSAKIPKFLSKSETVYTAKGKEGIEGLNARTLKDNKIDYNDDATIAVVIGKGETVNLDPLADSKINTGNYKRISYTGRDGKTYTDIYILPSKRTKLITGNTLEITTVEDKDLTIKGARVRKNKDSYVVKIIPQGEIVDLEETEGDWKKLKDGSGYIHITVFKEETKNTFDDSKGKKDEIVACDIPIKAGTTIGYTGNLGFEGFKGYKATHLEVFATDDVCEFLNNEKQDGKEEQYFTDIEAGTKLKTSLSYKVDIKANTPIKVLNIEGDYAQIKTTNIEGIVEKSLLGGYKSATGGSYYAISSNNVSKLNSSFKNALPSDLKKLYWVSRCDSSGNNLTKSEESKKIVDAKKLNKTYTPYRKVTYKPKNNGTFWIEKTSIAKITEKVEKKQDIYSLIIPEFLLTEEQKYDTVVREAKAEEKTTLYGDVCKAYIEVPFRTDVEEVTVEKEKLVDLRKFKKVKDDKKELWYKVALDYSTSSQCVAVEGWIKEKDLTKFSAYNWKKFGFKDLDAGNEYVYSIKDLRDATDSAAFVTEVWDKAIDEDGNKILDSGELFRAFNKPEIAQKLSRLVCKHKNEWSYTMAEIKPEIKELYDFGIQLEEDDAEKQKLETKRDDRLAKLETKIKDLMWWNEAKAKPYTPPVKEEDKTKTSSTKRPSMLPEGEQVEQKTPPTPIKDTPQKDIVPLGNKTTAGNTPTTSTPTPETKVEEKEVPPERMFPSTNVVHHFHPIAWVEQMKLLQKETGECYCNRDFSVEEFKNIFIRLRRSEKYNLNILNGNNCNIPNSDKILERLTEEFNITAKKYGINKCIQKIHFLAQIYWESDRLKTGLEYASGNYYNPNGGHKDAKGNGNTQAGDGPKYKGRGFMQLTWRNTQIKYLKHAAKNTDGALKGKSDAELELRSNNYEKYISDDLAYALDSAGWFWSNYKKAGSKYSEIKGKNLNEIALFQDKYQKYISILVNGGGNGKKEREKYYKKLKRFLKLDTKCINNKNSSVTSIDDSNTPWVKTAKGELGVEEIHGIDYNDPRVLEYHEIAGYTEKLMGRKITDDWIGDYKDAWCGSFVYWCYFKSGITKENLNKSGYNAYSWKNWGVESDKKEPCYGALAVCNFSHVGFVVGKKGNKIVLLGGNQSGGDTSTKGMVCYTTVKTEDIITYRYPSNFNIQNINYDLKEISTNSGSDNFGTSR